MLVVRMALVLAMRAMRVLGFLDYGLAQVSNFGNFTNLHLDLDKRLVQTMHRVNFAIAILLI